MDTVDRLLRMYCIDTEALGSGRLLPRGGLGNRGGGGGEVVIFFLP